MGGEEETEEGQEGEPVWAGPVDNDLVLCFFFISWRQWRPLWTDTVVLNVSSCSDSYDML